MIQETKHTPEPWQVDTRGLSCDVYDKDGKLVEIVFYADNGPKNEANAARIVACVNACEGMADPAAEIAALRARVAELEKGGRPMNNCTHEYAADGQFKRCLKCGVIWPTMEKEATDANG